MNEGGRRAPAHSLERPRRGDELAEVVSFTVPGNVRSIAVMQRLHMTRDPGDDFDHPKLPPGHPLRPHVLHRASLR